MLHSKINIAIVVSVFNSKVTEKLLEGALSFLMESGIEKDHTHVVKVPGAIEIPLTAKLLAQSKKYQAIICLGAVIRGETNHYEYVCQQVSFGCQQVMMDFSIPVIFGILTTKNMKQAQDRSRQSKHNKGREAAQAAVKMVKITQELLSLCSTGSVRPEEREARLEG